MKELLSVSRAHLRIWYTIGVLLAIMVIVVSLLPARNLPQLSLSDKLEHALSYCGLALWFSGLVPVRRYGWLAGALLLMGAAVELAQWLMGQGRQADPRDMMANAAGILVGLLLALAGLKQWVQWVERWWSSR